MVLSALERRPPPFFRQGPSALTRLVLFSALALFLMAADTRLGITTPLRAALATALRPAHELVQKQGRLAEDLATMLRGYRAALAAADAAGAKLVAQSAQLARSEQMQQENARLRALLELRPALVARSTSAEVLYAAPDPYSRKVFIDRGERHGIRPGSPVVNEHGVLGQVTAVYPLSAEVTLLVDRDAAIPVLNRRTQQRAAAFGGAPGGLLELRFVITNADIQVGDLLGTSGLDGVYPPELLVGRVSQVDRRDGAGFARILVTPAASADAVRHLLVLEPLSLQMPAVPAPGATATATPASQARGLASAASKPSGGPR
jgi:rod shape-determining protein MreC